MCTSWRSKRFVSRASVVKHEASLKALWDWQVHLLKSHEAMGVFVLELMNLHRGQGQVCALPLLAHTRLPCWPNHPPGRQPPARTRCARTQEIMWRDTNRCPTEDEYRQMVLDKTGGLFRLAVGLMQVFRVESVQPCRGSHS